MILARCFVISLNKKLLERALGLELENLWLVW